MKTIILTLTLFIYSNLSALEKNKVDVYKKDNHPSITLPTNFGKPFIIDKKQLDELKDYEIYRVDLVYTQFKTSPTFDQQALNENRIAELKKLIPQINKDNPNWNLIEQTGATTSSVAKNYFHGFEIFYKPKNNFSTELKTFMETFEKPTQQYVINATTENTLSYSSGTKIHIPANAMVDKNGKTITGNVQIEYTEFRNQADIALSGIPMTFESNGLNYNFTSKGMYEIRGYQNNEELFLKKPITVDFNCTSSTENTSFFVLDEKKGEWKEIHPIENVKIIDNKSVNKQVKVAAAQLNPNVEWATINAEINNKTKALGKSITTTPFDENTSICEMDKNAWKTYIQLKESNELEMFNIKPYEKLERSIKISKVDATKFVNMILFNGDIVQGFSESPFNGTLLAEGANAGHSYPNLVKGLNSKSFGVYNCDQIYRVGNPTTISPSYVDKNGVEIKDLEVACVMDLTYNGSFSFDPKYITLNKDGKNAILLFTKDKSVYIAYPKESSSIDYTAKKIVITMNDITASMKTSDDLAKLLGINTSKTSN
jgi:hypothetical protein